jgi:DNA (cytosine-5)-methyltransferase 1
MLTYGSLFAGIGGFDLGFERSGMTCLWQVENNKRCNKVLTHHWPGVERYGGIEDVGKHNLSSVDVVCGGFPCQDVSVAGKRKGLAGERSGLWFEFRRVLEELGPGLVVIENVPGLLSSNGGWDLATILRGLVELGYGVCWRVLDAQYFGVAQRRRRVFIVGSLGDGRAAEVLFESEGSAWGSPPSREKRKGVAATLSRGSAASRGVNEPGRRAEDDVNLVAAPLKSAPPTQRNGGSWPIAEEFIIARPLTAHPGRLDQDGETFIVGALCSHTERHGHAMTTQQAAEEGQVIAFAWQQGVSPDDRSYPVRKGEYAGAISSTRVDAIAFGVSENQRGEVCLTEDVSHQITTGGGKPGQGYPCIAFTEHTCIGGRNLEIQEELTYTLTNPGNGDRTDSRQVAGNFGVRCLTPRECERLQGFPDDWTLVGNISDSVRYRMLGNAVAVPVVEWIGRRIVTLESNENLDPPPV